MNQLFALRSEFEIKYYDRNAIVKKLQIDVLFILYTLFIDNFEFYRNMYRSLCDIYLTFIILNLQKRQRIRNVYFITFEFHESKFNDVIRVLKIDFNALKQDYNLSINEIEQRVWAFILTFIENMKFQQEIVEFLNSTIKLSCRMYHINKITKNNMNYDVIYNDRYHHQIFHIRFKCVNMTKTAREKFFVKKNDFWIFDIAIVHFRFEYHR